MIIILLSGTLFPLFAQSEYYRFYRSSRHVNTAGMVILGGWAVGNLVTGADAWSETEGPSKYFHHMNFYWNTVNLAISGIGLYTLLKQQPLRMSPQMMMENHYRYEMTFLINAGLDLGYIGTGYLLRSLSAKNAGKQDLLLGYGNSLLMQGGFLFLFDGVMYLVQSVRRYNYLNNISLSVLPRGGTMLTYTQAF